MLRRSSRGAVSMDGLIATANEMANAVIDCQKAICHYFAVLAFLFVGLRSMFAKLKVENPANALLLPVIRAAISPPDGVNFLYHYNTLRSKFFDFVNAIIDLARSHS